MDFGDIVYYLMAAIFFLYSVWSKSQKKKNQPGSPQNEGEVQEPSTFETVLAELMGQPPIEPEKPIVEESIVSAENLQQEVLEFRDDISIEDISKKKETQKSEKKLEDVLEVNNDEQAIDLKQAVIHSVILNRPEY